MTKLNKDIQDILKFVSRVNSMKMSQHDIQQLFQALLTPSEIEALSQRIHVVKMLHVGHSQREISEKLGVGVATATRGNRILKENQKLFERILAEDL